MLERITKWASAGADLQIAGVFSPQFGSWTFIDFDGENQQEYTTKSIYLNVVLCFSGVEGENQYLKLCALIFPERFFIPKLIVHPSKLR